MIKHLFSEMHFTEALTKVLWISCLVGAYSALVYLLFEQGYAHSYTWLSYFQSIFGIVLGLLLVFRSNRSYERWWEARTLWGELVNASRNLAIKIKVLLVPHKKEARQFSELINNFCDALAIHLRQKSTPDDFKALLNMKTLPEHVPSYLAKKLYTQLYQTPAAKEGINLWLLDGEFSKFMDICGGCERIKNTFISLSFRVFVKHVFIIFVLILPCSLVDALGVWMIPSTVLISYLIIAVEGIARNLEEPFGLTEDHLNLGAITECINASVNEILLSERK
ncbi:bestrophin family protein [Legionella spiritensis]|uniref:Bestrophin, RFP-TM, chloride channel n=1 Tax=Legionella spiritensis TaxID=452 RepID=A0A0W0YXV4_LEGSP|nr:bestrophin family ion channel [Legionella spiritensis]KTD61738.1 Bestrophin, RFP-TM, chloride channel [Legionella spiritensis]SNV38679.1 Predicted membrane protein [Legionella spiritensis]VEG90251.1 Predicted membrane protein [Legionella spiritensis]